MEERLEWSMTEGRYTVEITMDYSRWSGAVRVADTVVACSRNKPTLAEMRDGLMEELTEFYSGSMSMLRRDFPMEGRGQDEVR